MLMQIETAYGYSEAVLSYTEYGQIMAAPNTSQCLYYVKDRMDSLYIFV